MTVRCRMVVLVSVGDMGRVAVAELQGRTETGVRPRHEAGGYQRVQTQYGEQPRYYPTTTCTR
ncbi:MAG TPA: hypothetical protein VGC34_07975 [Steroidobacteraceae bacterium]